MTLGAQWNVIASAADISSLLIAFGGFHDACLREIHVFCETSVDDSLSMHCAGRLETSVRALFQRQSKGPSAVELHMTEVTSLIVAPTPENADSIINHATIHHTNGSYHLAVMSAYLPMSGTPGSIITREGADAILTIVCRGLKWRDASDWMGPALRYGSATEIA